jgi:hypothetical protein
MSPLDEAITALLRQLAITARGPRRDGLFALWLTLRVADGLVEGWAGPERAQRRRVAALEKRLTSLTLPAPLRRALVGTIVHFRELRPEAAAIALSQLVAPAGDSVGQEAGQALAAAARAAQQRVAATVRQR